MCLSAIYWARLPRVYFGNLAADASRIGFDDSSIYRELSLPLPQRKIQMTQLMHEEALKAFQAWQENPNKTAY